MPDCKWYMGIDPGMSGGIAVVSPIARCPLPEAWKMPETERDICELLAEYASLIQLVQAGAFAADAASRALFAANFVDSTILGDNAVTANVQPRQDIGQRIRQTEANRHRQRSRVNLSP